MKMGFDNQLYMQKQREHILERISRFNGKLYLEFGGKLFDDNHASRVLPGFEPDSKLKMLLQLKDRIEIVITINSSDIEKNKPSLLHGRAAAVMLQEEFGIEDKEIIQAVANHTFGCRGMCNLAKILFAADKIEPGRDYITNSYIKKLLKQDLDDVIKTVLSDNISYLKKKGKKVALETELLYASL